MGALVRFARDVIALGAFGVRLGLVFLLGMGLPMCLIGSWTEPHRQGPGVVAEPLYTASVALLAVVALVWFVRIREWFFPSPDLTVWETPPWDR